MSMENEKIFNIFKNLSPTKKKETLQNRLQKMKPVPSPFIPCAAISKREHISKEQFKRDLKVLDGKRKRKPLEQMEKRKKVHVMDEETILSPIPSEKDVECDFDIAPLESESLIVTQDLSQLEIDFSIKSNQLLEKEKEIEDEKNRLMNLSQSLLERENFFSQKNADLKELMLHFNGELNRLEKDVERRNHDSLRGNLTMMIGH